MKFSLHFFLKMILVFEFFTRARLIGNAGMASDLGRVDNGGAPKPKITFHSSSSSPISAHLQIFAFAASL
jgi:hypothetical protein